MALEGAGTMGHPGDGSDSGHAGRISYPLSDLTARNLPTIMGVDSKGVEGLDKTLLSWAQWQDTPSKSGSGRQ